jgi:YD repeat-containing protein
MSHEGVTITQNQSSVSEQTGSTRVTVPDPASLEAGAAVTVVRVEPETQVVTREETKTVAISGSRGPIGPTFDAVPESLSFTYDLSSRLSTITRTSDSTTKSFTYDGSGRLLTITDSRYGWVKTFSYNPDSTLAGISVS